MFRFWKRKSVIFEAIRESPAAVSILFDNTINAAEAASVIVMLEKLFEGYGKTDALTENLIRIRYKIALGEIPEPTPEKK